MKKENKFRLWDCDNKCFSYLDFRDLSKTISTLDSFREYFSDSYLQGDQDDYLHQFTGLKDCNGKDIYEGDIIRKEHKGKILTGKVLYEPQGARYIISVGEAKIYYSELAEGGMTGSEAGIWLHSCEILGNIFENSSILAIKQS